MPSLEQPVGEGVLLLADAQVGGIHAVGAEPRAEDEHPLEPDVHDAGPLAEDAAHGGEGERRLANEADALGRHEALALRLGDVGHGLLQRLRELIETGNVHDCSLGQRLFDIPIPSGAPLFDIPILHTYVDDFVRWLNRTFLNREWSWPVTTATS